MNFVFFALIFFVAILYVIYQTNNSPSPLRFAKTRDVKSPSRGTKVSAGVDFFVPNDFVKVNLPPGGSALIPSGIKVEVPKGYALIAFNKSGVATKKGLQIGACVVDEDYQGEVHLHMVNVSDKMTSIEPGDKIVQFILLPVYYAEVEELSIDSIHKTVTERGAGGFGSTGTK